MSAAWPSANRVAAGLLVGVVAWLALPRVFAREIAYYDEGVYVATAKALAIGSGYRNPAPPEAPPQAKYPPLLPLALSAVWRLGPGFPDNLVAMKSLVMLCGLGLLAVTWRGVRRRRGPLEAFALVALLGLSPVVQLFMTLVTSDVPYALLSLLAVDAYARGGERPRAFVAALLLAGLAVLTRTIGALLFAAMMADLLWRRKFARAVACAVAGTLVLGLWLAWSHRAGAAYAAYPPTVRANYVGYAMALSSASWMQDASTIARVNLRYLVDLLTGVVLPWTHIEPGSPVSLGVLALFLVPARGGLPGLAWTYCAAYLCCILLVPYPDTGRYAIALLPFLVARLLAGARSAIERISPAAGRRAAGAVLVVAATLAAMVVNARVDWRMRRARDPALWSGFHGMIDWIDQNLPANAILVGDFDPVYHLLTGRHAIRLSVNDNLATYYTSNVGRTFPHARELVDAFRRLGACYVVRDPMIGGREHVFFGNLIDALRAASPTPARVVYESPDTRFVVYRWAGCEEAPAVGEGRHGDHGRRRALRRARGAGGSGSALAPMAVTYALRGRHGGQRCYEPACCSGSTIGGPRWPELSSRRATLQVFSQVSRGAISRIHTVY